MSAQNLENRTYQGWKLVIGLFILLGACFVISFLIPIVAPVIGIALITGGAILYRQTRDGTMHAIAVAAIAGGIVIVLIVILFVLGLFCTDTFISGTYDEILSTV